MVLVLVISLFHLFCDSLPDTPEVDQEASPDHQVTKDTIQEAGKKN